MCLVPTFEKNRLRLILPRKYSILEKVANYALIEIEILKVAKTSQKRVSMAHVVAMHLISPLWNDKKSGFITPDFACTASLESWHCTEGCGGFASARRIFFGST